MPQQQPLLWVRSSEALGVLSKSKSQGLVVPGTGIGVNSKDHSQVPAWHLCPQGVPVSFQNEYAEHLKCEYPKCGKAHPPHRNVGTLHLPAPSSMVPE